MSFGPLKGGGCFVVSRDEAINGLTDLPRGRKARTLEGPTAKDAEPDFHLVEPGGMGRCIVEVDLRVV